MSSLRCGHYAKNGTAGIVLTSLVGLRKKNVQPKNSWLHVLLI